MLRQWELICEVCGKNEAVGVANCTLAQPCSHAYCRLCLQHHADPLWCWMTVLEIIGPGAAAEWVSEVRSYKDGQYIGYPEILFEFKRKMMSSTEGRSV